MAKRTWENAPFYRRRKLICFQYYFYRVLSTASVPRVINNNSSASTLLQNQAKQRHSFGLKEMSKLLPIAIAIALTNVNGLVFSMFCKRKRLRTASNYLLLGLVVCDFLTGTIDIPTTLFFHSASYLCTLSFLTVCTLYTPSWQYRPAIIYSS